VLLGIWKPAALQTSIEEIVFSVLAIAAIAGVTLLFL
jgi:hypothetical protein